MLVLLLALAGAGAAAWYGYQHRSELGELVTSANRLAISVGGQDRQSLETSPLVGFNGTPEGIDTTLQSTALWRVIKREFPDWYAERVKEASTLAGQRDERAASQHIARALVALRRQHAAQALSASRPRLTAIARTFFDNIVELRKHSVDACYAFISHGEVSPIVVSLLQGSPHTARLQAQLTAVFEAIAEGRKTPRTYPSPKKADYDALSEDLGRLGWNEADRQLFSNAQALANASPDKVCQLVHDWFAAQLAVKDPDMQLRLLVDALRPVVAG
jgi:hypothetical protein